MPDDDDIEKKKTFLKLFLAGCSLTKREMEVLVLLAKGKKNKEVAELLHLSYFTIRFHRANIFKKLNVKNKFDAGKLAEKMGLV